MPQSFAKYKDRTLEELAALAVQLKFEGKTPEYELQYLAGLIAGKKILANVETTAIQAPRAINLRSRKSAACTRRL